MRPILFRPRLLTSCALLALGLHGMTARSLVAQFDPRRFLPGPTTWEDRDAGGPADAGKKAPDEAPARDNRFSAGDGPAERFGAGATPSGSFSAAAGAAPRRGSPAGARTLDLGPGDGKRVVVIPVEGTIDLGLAPFSRRIVEEAGRAGDVAAIVLDINTFGGRVDAAVQIRDALLSSEVPTVAFVNRRAISAGALISLACDVIAVTGGATMGAATPVAISGGKAQPVEEKVVSYMRKEMRATAEAKGRDGDIAEAMVDAQVEVPGISDKGKLLTLTTREGLEHGVFDLEVERVEALLDATNLTGATVDKARVNWAERVARLLTDPVVSGMLMTFGFLGILIELYTAGFGIAGIVGVVCLCLFFLGHVVADLAGWEELLLFSVGLLLIGLEAFGVGGGLGILAITGAGCVVSSLVMALMEAPLDLSWASGALAMALTRVAIALVITLLAAVILARAAPRMGLIQRLVLQEGLAGSVAAAPDVETESGEALDLTGQEGEVLTALRPFGKARIGGRRVEVTTEGGFVEAGTTVRVCRVEGRNVVVRPVTPDVEEEA